MSNAGVTVIAGLMMLIGLAAGWYNSYLIMGMVKATDFMWMLWWGSLVMVILGSILMTLAKE